jgi:hypothetical protein
MTSIDILHVSAAACHRQGVFQVKVVQVQHANLGMLRCHWNDKNIKALKYIKLVSIKLPCCDSQTI